MEKPKVTWKQFYKKRKGRKRNNQAKAKNKSRLINALMSEEDFGKALKKVELSSKTLQKYFKDEDFQKVLDKIAPYMSAHVLCNVLDIANGGDRKEVHLKANLELLKEFAPRATDGAYSFDGGVRKARTEGEESRASMTFKDMVRVMANDPFIDYSKEIRQIREEEAEPGPKLLNPGELANAEIMVEDWEEETE